MKQMIRFITVLVAIFATAIVMQAQEATEEQTILELASTTEDLSTLVATIEAADPAIAETLAGEGPFTVFAPSNQAFENLIATLDIDAETLLADSSLDTILQYHVVAGEITAEDLATRDEGFVETVLPDNFIGVTIADDGTVVLNDVVTVVTANVEASNGVVHIVDDVLLPLSALQEFGLVEADNANVQVLHFSPDAPAVDVYVDGELTFENLGFGSSSGYATVPAGEYDVAVTATGTPVGEAVIGPVTLNFANGDFINVAAVGSVGDGTLTATVFNQELPLLEDDQFGLTVLHAVEGAPNVDLVANDQVIIEDLAYPFTAGENDGAFNLVGVAPIETLTVNVANESTVLLDLSGTALETGTYYLVVVGGTADAPQAYVYPITPERADELSDALYDMDGMDEMEDEGMDSDDEDMSGEETDNEMATGTIADIVIESANADEPQFTILLQAVQNADPAILETLQGEGPITVFAPTDTAFSNLLSVIDLTPDELLASEFLNDILLYHVVSGNVTSEDVAGMDGQLVPTLLGDDNNIGVTVNADGTVTLNDVVGLVQTDIPATNGTVHVIDDVLLPGYTLDALGLDG